MKSVLAIVAAAVVLGGAAVFFVLHEEHGDSKVSALVPNVIEPLNARGNNADDDDGKMPDCCKAFNWIPYMDIGEEYNVDHLLEDCKDEHHKCNIKCPDMMTSQSCVMCCKTKQKLDNLPNNTKFDDCRRACKQKFSCTFEESGPAVADPTCGFGKCDKLDEGAYKCVSELLDDEQTSVCTCVLDWKMWLEMKQQNK